MIPKDQGMAGLLTYGSRKLQSYNEVKRPNCRQGVIEAEKKKGARQKPA